MIRSILVIVATFVALCFAASGAFAAPAIPNNGNVSQNITIPGFGTMSMNSNNSEYGAYASAYFSTSKWTVVGQNSFLMPGYEPGHVRFEVNTFMKWKPIDVNQSGYNSQGFNVDLRPMMNLALSGSTSLEHQRQWSLVDSTYASTNIVDATVNYGYLSTYTYSINEKGYGYMEGAMPQEWNTMIRTNYDISMFDKTFVLDAPIQMGSVVESVSVPEPGALTLLALTPLALLGRRRSQLATV